MSESRIKENYRRLEYAFGGYNGVFRIFYSAKANTNVEILKILEAYRMAAEAGVSRFGYPDAHRIRHHEAGATPDSR
ncbi:MAG: hypothetical protein ACLFVP_08885 [Candidatus Bathyarchaeia archaeon]